MFKDSIYFILFLLLLLLRKMYNFFNKFDTLQIKTKKKQVKTKIL